MGRISLINASAKMYWQPIKQPPGTFQRQVTGDRD